MSKLQKETTALLEDPERRLDAAITYTVNNQSRFLYSDGERPQSFLKILLK